MQEKFENFMSSLKIKKNKPEVCNFCTCNLKSTFRPQVVGHNSHWKTGLSPVWISLQKKRKLSKITFWKKKIKILKLSDFYLFFYLFCLVKYFWKRLRNNKTLEKFQKELNDLISCSFHVEFQHECNDTTKDKWSSEDWNRS